MALNQHVSSLWMLLCKGLETSGGGFSWKGARKRGDGDLGCDSVVENVLSVFKFPSIA